ncbi:MULTISPECIES: sulfite exporter TauE/SafE family protein [Sphingomonas]|uniref:Probable membrane transporter protein n=1 Tax=Sphingomonas kyungheensis TaxID=1069987 RepID=A0ABU8H223_9SPHN|nr:MULTISPECIES: sulfite exporter TauE/SafE family protein [unclassified Sphingomonas]
MADINPLYTLAGVGVGTLVGLTGVGGGSLMTPLLVLAFGFHPATAVGTDLLYASATKSVGTVVHGVGGTVDWRVVGRLATGSIPATLATLGVMSWSGAQLGGAAHIITATLGAALLATAIAILFRRQIVAYCHARLGTMSGRSVARSTILLGVLLGVMVSLTSVGAGALGMTVLLVLYPQLPTNRLVGSDIAHAVPLTLIAGSGHWLMGSVDVGLLASLLIGSVPGIIFGSLISTRISDDVLRPILAVTLALVGWKMFF